MRSLAATRGSERKRRGTPSAYRDLALARLRVDIKRIGHSAAPDHGILVAREALLRAVAVLRNACCTSVRPVMPHYGARAFLQFEIQIGERLANGQNMRTRQHAARRCAGKQRKRTRLIKQLRRDDRIHHRAVWQAPCNERIARTVAHEAVGCEARRASKRTDFVQMLGHTGRGSPSAPHSRNCERHAAKMAGSPHDLSRRGIAAVEAESLRSVSVVTTIGAH